MLTEKEIDKLAERTEIELIKRYAKKGDILKWGKLLFPEKFYLPFCYELHNYFIEIKDMEFTATLAPRSHAKTLIRCFLIPMFMACNNPKTYSHYLNVQSTASKAIDINIALKSEFEHNEKLIEIYENQINDEKWTEKQFVLKNGIIFSGAGVGESLRGKNYKNVRPDYIICDDLYDDDDIYNLRRIEKKERWFWGTLYPARARGRKSCIHLQGTSINKQDLLHKAQKNTSIISKIFKAIKYNEDGSYKILWKELNSYDELMAQKEKMGSIIFDRELNNKLRDDETSIIKEAWIKYYDRIPENEKVIFKGGYIDPSIGKKQTSDFTAMAAVYITQIEGTKSFRYYIVDAISEHLSFHKRIEKAENFHVKHSFDKVKIEAISGFMDFYDHLKNTTNIPVESIESKKDKLSELESISFLFENGKVFINSKIPTKIRNLIVEQLINNYPNNDDLRDVVIMGLKTKNERKRETKEIIQEMGNTASNTNYANPILNEVL